MKLAHLLLVHKNPQQVKRLITRLIHSKSDIFIHIDLKCDMADYEDLAIADNVYFIKNRIKVNWGGYSTLQAIINGFEEIITNGCNYSHINLLSGQDYPLKDIAEIQDFLFNNTDRSFLEYHSIEDEWHNGRVRVAKYSFGDFEFPGNDALERVVNFFTPNRKMPLNLKPYGRSTWLTITPVAAQYIIDFLNKHPRVKRYFRMMWGSDEVVIQTILLNSYMKGTVVNNNLRFIDLGENAHARILTTDDADQLINSEKLFARKFDLNTDHVIFDYLDASIAVGNVKVL